MYGVQKHVNSSKIAHCSRMMNFHDTWANHIILYFHNLKTQYNEKITKYKDTTYGGVIKRPMRPVSDYPFDKNMYKYILQKKHVDIINTRITQAPYAKRK